MDNERPSPPVTRDPFLVLILVAAAMALMVSLVQRERRIQGYLQTHPRIPEWMKERVFAAPLDPLAGLLLFTPDEVEAARSGATQQVSDICPRLVKDRRGELAEAQAEFMVLLNEFVLFKDTAEVTNRGFTMMVTQQRQRLLHRVEMDLGEACRQDMERWLDADIGLDHRLERSLQTLQAAFSLEDGSPSQRPPSSDQGEP